MNLKDILSFVKSPAGVALVVIIVVWMLWMYRKSRNDLQFGGQGEGYTQSPSSPSSPSPTSRSPKPLELWMKRYVTDRPTNNLKNGAVVVGPHLYKAYQAVDPHIKEAYIAALPHILEAAKSAGPVVAVELRELSEALSELSYIIEGGS